MPDLAAEVAELRKLVEIMSGTPQMRRAITDAQRIDEIKSQAEARAAWCLAAPTARVRQLRAMSALARDRFMSALKLERIVEACRDLGRADREYVIGCAPPAIRDRARIELLDATDLPDLVRLALAPGSSYSAIRIPDVLWTDSGGASRCDEALRIDAGYFGVMMRAELDDRLERDEPLRGAIAAGNVVADAITDERVRRNWLIDEVQRGNVKLLRAPVKP